MSASLKSLSTMCEHAGAVGYVTEHPWRFWHARQWWTAATNGYAFVAVRGSLTRKKQGHAGTRTVGQEALMWRFRRGKTVTARHLLKHLSERQNRHKHYTVEPVEVAGVVVDRLLLLRALRAVGLSANSGGVRCRPSFATLRGRPEKLRIDGDGFVVVVMCGIWPRPRKRIARVK